MLDHLNREVEVFNAALLLPAARRADYLDEICQNDPELLGRVETLLEAHDRAGAFLQEPASGATSPKPPDPNRTTHASTAPAEKTGDRIGRYRLLQQIGEGGCGVVYMAEQEEPVHRRVALKVIKLGMDTRSVVARFEAERQALALMDHPNIAKVLDAGTTETGRPFFVMELVRGFKITEYCDTNGLSTPERLNLFVKVCRAIQHAHQKGIIHRDIKPSNILVTVNDGVPVPKVIDFGIAKATQGRLTDQTLFTAFEQFVGTPAYMSPEQSVFTSVDVDTRSDIYSLGVLLYELLTGRTPFDQKELLAGGLEEMRRTIREKEPLRPSTRLSTMVNADLATVARHRHSEPPRLIHQVHGDLDWIVMKCLEKERARRYETANDLAVDVQRFLDSEPIVARPPSNLYRLQKFVRRNKLAVAAGGSVFAALIVGLSLSTWQFVEKSRAEREQSRLREEAQRAQANEVRARRQAEAQESAARKKAYASDMNLLQQALAADDLGRAQDLLNRQRPQPGDEDLRGWEWRYFWQFCQSDATLTLCQRSNSIVSVSFSADGSLVAVGTFGSEITVWDIATRSMIFHRQAQPGGTGKLAFARNTNILAYCDGVNRESYVVLWDSRTRSETHRLRLNEAIRDLAFARDGRLFTCEWNVSNTVAVWDVESGSNLGRFPARVPPNGMGTVFNVTEDGTRFVHAVYGAPRSVRIASIDGSADSRFQVTDELTTAVAFSKDGQTLITGGGYAEGAVKLWDVNSRQLVGKLDGHRSWVSCLSLLPDGKTLASASADRTIRLWDLPTRQPIRTLRGQSGELWTIDISPDGRWLASGGKDGSVIFWDLTSSANRPPSYRGLDIGGAWRWGFSSDNHLVCVNQAGRLKFYDARTLEPTSEPSFSVTNATDFAYSPDGRLLTASDSQGHLSVWDIAGSRLLTNFVAHSPSAYILSSGFASAGRSLLTCGTSSDVKEWDVATWKEIRRWQITKGLTLGSICPATSLFAAGNGFGTFELLTTFDPEKRKQFNGESRVVGIQLAPDGKTLATASENGTVELWDTETATRRALLHGILLGYHSVAISPDGERVAAGSNGMEAIKMWDLHSREEVATLQGQGSFFSDATFSPDGNTVAARNWNGVIDFWTAPSWQEIELREKARSVNSP